MRTISSETRRFALIFRSVRQHLRTIILKTELAQEMVYAFRSI